MPQFEELRDLQRTPGFRGVIPASDAKRVAASAGVDIDRLMTMLLPFAAEYAKPPVSNFKVGAVSRGTSGNLYYGTNLEFAGDALSFTVHAEQSSVMNAWMNGEDGIDRIAVTAAPCGYCRQFLNELVSASGLVVTNPMTTSSLSDLLPSAFGPRDLGISGGLMHRDRQALSIDAADDVAQAALAAASMSYAPYSKSYAGVAVMTRHGAIAAGAYAENAAFNPSFSPLPAALSQLNLAGHPLDEVAEVVLVRIDELHDGVTKLVLSKFPEARLRVLAAGMSR